MGDIEALRALTEAAHDEVVRLCEPGQTWRMSIPANPARDSDLILVEAITAIGPLLDRLAETEAAVERVRALAGEWEVVGRHDRAAHRAHAKLRAAIDGTA